MDGGFAPRLLVELAFLALLALAAGLAELSPAWVVAIMTLGWVLVVLVEWLAWRGEIEQAETASQLGLPGDGGVAEDGWDIEEILAPLPEGDGEPGLRAPDEPGGGEGR